MGIFVEIPVALDAFPWYMSIIEWERLHALTIISAPSSLASEITAADCLSTVGSSDNIPGAPTLRTLPVSYTHLRAHETR